MTELSLEVVRSERSVWDSCRRWYPLWGEGDVRDGGQHDGGQHELVDAEHDGGDARAADGGLLEDALQAKVLCGMVSLQQLRNGRGIRTQVTDERAAGLAERQRNGHMVDGVWAGGTCVSWGTLNREAPVRLCNAASRSACNFELRFVDGPGSL
ncbi:hypothetical protein FIBSPDRAFT_904528 [Athelia psychrophila]|uniref:Uncharacterized protein n=1 Tax=Athelia psychrophila TaxID=1759441 RepID=A0A167UMI0_9AGAM|nr:hypothetical protein FIBSPDRAFT_904528 [Fibularhizoctonia sp. CBS 109695]